MTTLTRLDAATVLIGLIGISLLGCSADSTTHHDPGSPALDAAIAEPESDGGTTGASLKAPVVTQTIPMAGGLHVVWTNTQKDCDAIEGERKSASEAYKVVFTIPDGSVNNKHDAPLTAGTTYTYRVRCKKGAAYSAYSNEKSGKP